MINNGGHTQNSVARGMHRQMLKHSVGGEGGHLGGLMQKFPNLPFLVISGSKLVLFHFLCVMMFKRSHFHPKPRVKSRIESPAMTCTMDNHVTVRQPSEKFLKVVKMAKKAKSVRTLHQNHDDLVNLIF